MNRDVKYNCIFGGGAIRGIAYIGAIKALRELKIEINTIAGSSVGAIFAALFAVDYSCEDLKNVFFDFNYAMFKDLNFGIGASFALSKGELFLNWLRELIEKQYYGKAYIKGENEPVKFKDIEKDLYILSSDLSSNKCVVFSKKTSPEMEIATAIRISACFPGLMKPIEHENHLFIDGDLIKSWPLWKTDENLCTKGERVLEFRLEGCKECGSIKSPLEYFNAVFSAFNNFCTENVINQYAHKDKFDYIVIDTKDILLIDFTLPEEKRMELIDNGYKTTMKYFKKDLVEKKKNILPLYEELLKKTIIIENFIIDKKISDAKSLLSELMGNIYEPLEYIDKCYYNEFKELKDIFETNSREKLLFKGLTLKNNKHVICKTNQIITKLEEKTEELKNYIKNYE